MHVDEVSLQYQRRSCFSENRATLVVRVGDETAGGSRLSRDRRGVEPNKLMGCGFKSLAELISVECMF